MCARDLRLGSRPASPPASMKPGPVPATNKQPHERFVAWLARARQPEESGAQLSDDFCHRPSSSSSSQLGVRLSESRLTWPRLDAARAGGGH